LQKQLRVIGNTLLSSKVIAYSSISGKGRDDIWNEISGVI